MRFAPGLDYPSPDAAALLKRSQMNIRRSRALVASATGLVRATQRIRRPKFAGSSDAPSTASAGDANSRAVRTWTKMRGGALPTDAARWRWVGPGRGDRCNGCSDRIEPHETEYEIDFDDVLLLRLHRGCFKIWQSFNGHRH